ncbi:MAG: GAP family protein [Solirubrobacteraceae bacterium]
MGKILGLAFVAALNLALLAATTIMLLLPRPSRLMIGYWLGAMLTAVTTGLVIVFVLEGSSFEHSAKKTAHPVISLALAGILLAIVVVLATGLHKPIAERRAKRKAAKRRRGEETPTWQRQLSKDSPRITFVVGALLSFPGASYLVALDTLGKQHYATAATVLAVVGFCLVEPVLLEGAIIAFWIWPEQAPAAIDRTKSWGRAYGRMLAICGLSVVAAGLAAIGISELV